MQSLSMPISNHTHPLRDAEEMQLLRSIRRNQITQKETLSRISSKVEKVSVKTPQEGDGTAEVESHITT